MPRLADQAAFYRDIIDAAGDKPVVFRTLDLGGDKVLPLCALGARGKSGARLARHPHRARSSRVASLPGARAADGGRRPRLRILLPMVSNVDEFNRARALVDREIERAPAGRHGPAAPGAGRRHARSSLARLHAAAADALGRFRLHRLERSSVVRLRGRPHQPARRPALRQPQSRRPHADPADREQFRRGAWRAVALRRDGGQAARRDGAAGTRPAYPLHAAGQYRTHQDDDPQHGSERSIARSSTSFAAAPTTACGPAWPLWRRAGHRPQIGCSGAPKVCRTKPLVAFTGGQLQDKTIFEGCNNSVATKSKISYKRPFLEIKELAGWLAVQCVYLLPDDQSDPPDARRQRQYEEPPHPSARDFRRQRHPAGDGGTGFARRAPAPRRRSGDGLQGPENPQGPSRSAGGRPARRAARAGPTPSASFAPMPTIWGSTPASPSNASRPRSPDAPTPTPRRPSPSSTRTTIAACRRAGRSSPPSSCC